MRFEVLFVFFWFQLTTNKHKMIANSHDSPPFSSATNQQTTENDHASTKAQLKSQTLHIVHSINARDLQAPLHLYASPDYTYEDTEDNGQILKLSGPEMLSL